MTNIKQNRFATIAKLGEYIFSVEDFVRLWGIRGATLAVTLKRYCDSKLLYRIHRGLYSLLLPSQLDPIVLGAKAISSYSYLGAETVLVKHGAIFQELSQITFMGQKSKRLFIAGHSYYCRQLAEKYLFNDAGIFLNDQGTREASPERAAADILYLNPRYHFDNPSVLDWNLIRQIQKTVYNR